MHAPILVVEDDQSHALLISRVLAKARLANPVVAFHDGNQAFDYLSGHGEYGDRERQPLPVLVLLDLHVPGISGLDLLQHIRERPDLQSLPVIIFSGSGESGDINRAFELGVDTYLVKPVAFDALLDAIGELRLDWVLLGRDGDGSSG